MSFLVVLPECTLEQLKLVLHRLSSFELELARAEDSGKFFPRVGRIMKWESGRKRCWLEPMKRCTTNKRATKKFEARD